MAKKLSRAKRKQEQLKQQKALHNKQSIARAQAEKQRQTELKIARKNERIRQEKEIKKRETFKKQSESRAKKLWYKQESLEALGFDRKHASKVKYADIEAYKNGNEYALSIEKYPFLYIGSFDFKRIYKCEKNRYLYFAFLDYFGENSVEDNMKMFAKKKDSTLIAHLDAIVHQPTTYNKDAPNRGAGTSSGRAGTFRQRVCTEEIAREIFKNANNNLKRSFEDMSVAQKRMHSGSNKYYQTFVSDENMHVITEISGHQLLVILNAIFYNITEDSRDMYKTTYKNVISTIPAFEQFLPKP